MTINEFQSHRIAESNDFLLRNRDVLFPLYGNKQIAVIKRYSDYLILASGQTRSDVEEQMTHLYGDELSYSITSFSEAERQYNGDLDLELIVLQDFF